MVKNDIKRLTRLTAILTQLQSKRLLTASQLAEKFEVSNKTIYRDIKALENAGVPVITEEGKGYTLMDGYRLPPIMFTEEEASALLTAELLIQASKDTSLIKKFEEVILKVKSVMPAKILERNERLEKKMGVSNTYIDNSPKSRYLLAIQKALVDHAVVHIDYTDKIGQSTQRTLEPFAIYSNQKYDWIMVAFCRLRKDFRSFSLVNIDKFTVTTEKFTPHQITFETYLNQKFNHPVPQCEN